MQLKVCDVGWLDGPREASVSVFEGSAKDGDDLLLAVAPASFGARELMDSLRRDDRPAIARWGRLSEARMRRVARSLARDKADRLVARRAREAGRGSWRSVTIIL